MRKINTLLILQTKQALRSKKFLKEFPHKSWSRSGLNKIIRKIDRTGTSRRLPSSGRLLTKLKKLKHNILSQEDLPQIHRTQRQIAREVGIGYLNVPLIVL